MDECFIGSIQLFPYAFTPLYWALCDGSILKITDNTELFALIGTTYGGDGSTTFALPNMQGLEPNSNLRYYICVEGIWPPQN